MFGHKKSSSKDFSDGFDALRDKAIVAPTVKFNGLGEDSRKPE